MKLQFSVATPQEISKQSWKERGHCNTDIQRSLMRTVNTLLHRWQGYSGRNPFLWIEPPKILALQCILYFCHSALYHLNVIYEDLIWGFFPVDVIKIYCINLIHLIQGARGHWVELDQSLESFLESQQRPGRTSKKSATQKCQKHFSNNLRGCVVPQRWHCILFRTGTQAWKLNPSCGFHFEQSFSSVSRPAYSSSNRCSSTVMS